jgi:uncharacterized membrane protein
MQYNLCTSGLIRIRANYRRKRAMRKIVLAILVLFVCLSMSVSCTKKSERKEEKKEAGVVEKAIIGPIEKARGIQENSKERADVMEKQADDISGETKEGDK